MAKRGSPRGRGKTHLQIQGLDDFLRDLKLLPGRWKAAEQVFEATAAVTVAQRAKAMARSGDKIQARSAADIRVGGHGTVVYGGQGYSMGAEFGAYRYNQFKTWRGNQDDAGYFLWPTIRKFRDDDMLDEWAKEVWRAIKPAFPSRR